MHPRRAVARLSGLARRGSATITSIRIEALAEISETALTHDVAIATRRARPAEHFRARPQSGVFDFRRRRSPIGAASAHIVGGMCETDFSGYPDCRDDTIKAMQLALNLGMDARFVHRTRR